MAIRYYDDILVAKLKKWIPDNRKIRVLKPDETKRLFEITADDNKDKPIELPLIALSRNSDIELLLNVKAPKSFAGLTLAQTKEETLQFNVIPIKVLYQIDIYTKTADDGDEYVRELLFKLINNPVLKIEIPYQNLKNMNEAHNREDRLQHIANIRVLSNVSDTSNISERIFSGQFTRWTIQLEIQDAFLFSIPYRSNWRMEVDDTLISMPGEERSMIELSDKISEPGEIEQLDFNIQKTI